MGKELSSEVDDGSIEVNEEVAELMEMDEEERNEYCKEVIMAVAKGFEDILQISGKIPQAKALKEYMGELQEKMSEIRVVLFYTIKPEFRDVYLKLIETFSGVSL